MTTLHEKMIAEIELVKIYKENTDGKKIVVVDEFPSLDTLPRTYLGSFVWTTKDTRYIKAPFAREVQDVIMSPADMARCYLTYKYGGQRRRCYTDAYQKCFKPCHKSIPLYALPTVGELVYLDLESAYWNIVRTCGWDVDYHPDEFIGVSSDNEDFPFQSDKLARNILVSTGLPSESQVWTGKKIISTKGRNKLYNGILWCFVQDIMNTVAWDMVNAGAVYVHTDGYIFHECDEQAGREVAKSWGLPLGVKYRGDGEVFGVSNYWIRGKKHRNPRSSARVPHINIDPAPSGRWLKGEFLKWRKQRGLA